MVLVLEAVVGEVVVVDVAEVVPVAVVVVVVVDVKFWHMINQLGMSVF